MCAPRSPRAPGYARPVPPRPTPLGDFIRRQRELQELTLRQLADAAGISNPYLSQIERGLREPSEKVLAGIARTLEMSLDAVYEQSGALWEDEGEPEGAAVIAAIEADERLTARRKRALIEVYEALATAPEARRRPRGARRRD